MKIGVISDTHGDLSALKRAAERIGAADAWIHLGDHCADSAPLKRLNPMVYSVKGNCDPFPGLMEIVIEFEGVKVFAVHGHTYGVKDGLSRLYYRALELGCSAALYGHTHVPNLERNGTFFLLNPGSPARPRMWTKPSAGILTIKDGVLDAEILTL